MLFRSNAHATGTPAGDRAELAAFDSALGEVGRTIPISATKSTTGHLLGASGVVEAIIATLTMRDQMLPPTLNLDDNEFPEWDIVSGHARKASEGSNFAEAAVDTVLSTSFGFGGHNGAIILRRIARPATPSTDATDPSTGADDPSTKESR